MHKKFQAFMYKKAELSGIYGRINYKIFFTREKSIQI